ASSETLDDLPGSLIFLVGVGACEVEVQLVGVYFRQELTAAGEVFQIEELVFFEAMHRFNIALVSVRGRRDAHVLAIAESCREISLEFGAVVGLPDQIAQRDAVAMQMPLDARGEHCACR